MTTQNAVYISKHAQEKYRKLTKFTGSPNKTLTTLIYMMDEAEPFEPDPEYKVKSLIRHQFRPTEYFLSKNNAFVLVVVNGNLATLFKYTEGDKQMWRAY